MGNVLGGFKTAGSLEEQAAHHRLQASQLAEQQRQVSLQSQAAFRSKNGALAKELSMQAKAIHLRVEEHNSAAARLYFEHHNKGAPAGTIDLHGLFVKEAIRRLEAFVAKAQKGQMGTIRVVVGAGNHSQDGVQRIRPAVETWLHGHGHEFTAVNQGCLEVRLARPQWSCSIM